MHVFYFYFAADFEIITLLNSKIVFQEAIRILKDNFFAADDHGSKPNFLQRPVNAKSASLL